MLRPNSRSTILISLTRWAFAFSLAMAMVTGPYAYSKDNKAAIAVAPERIVTPLPRGWTVAFHAKNGRQEIREFLPAGETVEKWSEMVTTKIFDGINRGAEEYNNHTMKRFAALCAEATKVVGQTEDRFGYSSSLAFIECITTAETRKKNKYVRKVEFLVQLAIKGNDALYVAESAWHTDDMSAPRPTTDANLLRRITSRLDKVFVCDDRTEEKSCRTLHAKAQ